MRTHRPSPHTRGPACGASAATGQPRSGPRSEPTELARRKCGFPLFVKRRILAISSSRSARFDWPLCQCAIFRGEHRASSFFRDKQVGRREHLHVVDAGSRVARDYPAFRDYLRSHPEAATSYAAANGHFCRSAPATATGTWTTRSPSATQS
ncbi:GrpB family protein [Microlunatus elymi]|uniref:GrpB family protein n=1 Tax=Microlunatus elymi TaxID=2596828 RepID=A0A516PYH6_9ACTN|nr:GrpB family protein [Microlunatus elymi]